MTNLVEKYLDKQMAENKRNLGRWIMQGIPLKIEKWADGKYYIGPDTDWCTAMIMQPINMTDPLLKALNLTPTEA